MTNPESAASVRYALLTNGSNFSCAVVRRLCQREFLPSLLVLPEYPPASTDGDILQVSPIRELLSMTREIEKIYAPHQWQSRAAEQILSHDIDYILVACWPYLIDAELRSSPRRASLNLHPSILPRYRGANPLQQQIAANDCKAGTTLHLLDAQFDRGDIIGQREFDVEADQLELSWLETRCAKSGVEMFIDAVRSGPGSWRLSSQSDQDLETD